MGKFAFNTRILTIFTIKNSSYLCLQQWSTDILGHKGQSWKVELLYIAIFYPDFFTILFGFYIYLKNIMQSCIYKN